MSRYLQKGNSICIPRPDQRRIVATLLRVVSSNSAYRDLRIYILEGSSARIGFTDARTAVGNLIEGNGADGIQVSQASSAVWYGNTIQQNG